MCLVIVLRYLTLLLIGSVVCGGTLYIVYLFRLVVYHLLPAWCCVCLPAWCICVCYYFNVCTWCWFVCVGYSLYLCYILAICVRGVDIGYMLFNSLVLACSFVTLTLYHLATITALYCFISLLFVFIRSLGVAGLYYDNAPLKGAYLLVLLGWYYIFSFLLTYTNEKRK